MASVSNNPCSFCWHGEEEAPLIQMRHTDSTIDAEGKEPHYLHQECLDTIVAGMQRRGEFTSVPCLRCTNPTTITVSPPARPVGARPPSVIDTPANFNLPPELELDQLIALDVRDAVDLHDTLRDARDPARLIVAIVAQLDPNEIAAIFTEGPVYSLVYWTAVEAAAIHGDLDVLQVLARHDPDDMEHLFWQRACHQLDAYGHWELLNDVFDRQDELGDPPPPEFFTIRAHREAAGNDYEQFLYFATHPRLGGDSPFTAEMLRRAVEGSNLEIIRHIVPHIAPADLEHIVIQFTHWMAAQTPQDIDTYNLMPILEALLGQPLRNVILRMIGNREGTRLNAFERTLYQILPTRERSSIVQTVVIRAQGSGPLNSERYLRQINDLLASGPVTSQCVTACLTFITERLNQRPPSSSSVLVLAHDCVARLEHSERPETTLATRQRTSATILEQFPRPSTTASVALRLSFLRFCTIALWLCTIAILLITIAIATKAIYRS